MGEGSKGRWEKQDGESESKRKSEREKRPAQYGSGGQNNMKKAATREKANFPPVRGSEQWQYQVQFMAVSRTDGSSSGKKSSTQGNIGTEGVPGAETAKLNGARNRGDEVSAGQGQEVKEGEGT
jgi:hypothetical protein